MIQLIYVSAATVEFSDEELKTLLITARTNNEQLGISGMLVFHTGSFLQILEGEQQAVFALYDKIERDHRHRNVKVLLRTEINERSFGEWKMGFYDASGTMKHHNPAFVDFFRRCHELDDATGDRAKAVLMQFREGAWRQHVNITN